VNTALPNPLVLQVLTSSGPLPGIPVGWIVTSGGGSIKVSTSITDSNGTVSATWTLGPTAGTQTVRAIPFFYSGVSIYDFNGATFTATGQGSAGAVTPNVPNGGVLNGAGFDSAVSGLSAGAIASIFGTNLSSAPASGVQPGFVPGTTTLQTTSNGTQVTFDGVAAPLFFISPGQLNVQVPFEVTGKTSVQMVVSLNGAVSPPVTVAISAATPALFTLNSSGGGAAVALNQDGSLNGPGNAEAAGRVIQLYATGLGAVLPQAVTGQGARSTAPLSTSVNIPTVTIGAASVSANVEFSGLAPGFVGLWQVNVRVPAGAGSGKVPILLRAGGQNANPITVFLK
jgi:minor extracellular serine protease Vpr